jgi:hypothetical protein
MSVFDSMFQETAKVPAATCSFRGGKVSMASFCFLFLGVGSMFKQRRGSFPSDLLRTERERESLGVRGTDLASAISCHHRWGIGQALCFPQGMRRAHPFVLGAVAFLPLALITLSGHVPAGQRGRVRLELGTSQLSVNKVSGVRLR